MLRSSYPLWFGHPNNIWWRVRSMELLIYTFFSASYHLILQNHKMKIANISFDKAEQLE
jgi:hypothetical protein